jgi:hypothetical protein
MTDLDWIAEISATLYDPTCCYFRRRDIVMIPFRPSLDLIMDSILLAINAPLTITSIMGDRIYLQWMVSSDMNHGTWITFERAHRLGMHHL